MWFRSEFRLGLVKVVQHQSSEQTTLVNNERRNSIPPLACPRFSLHQFDIPSIIFLVRVMSFRYTAWFVGAPRDSLNILIFNRSIILYTGSATQLYPCILKYFVTCSALLKTLGMKSWMAEVMKSPSVLMVYHARCSNCSLNIHLAGMLL